MNLSGVNISGYNYIGSPTLSTIGQQLFWYDYRYNYDTRVVSATTRVSNWRSLATAGTPLDTANSAYLYYFNNGFGYESTGTGNPRNKGNLFTELNLLHNGTGAWMFSTVFRFDYTSGSASSASSIFSTGGSTTKPGIIIQIINASTPRIRVQIFDAANNAIINWSLALSTVPTGRYIPVTIIYYGDTSAGNYKMYVEGTAYTFNGGSPSYSSAAPNQFNVGGLVTAINDFKLKLLVGYNLTGKTRTQVDTFVTLYNTTLKADSEYSSLTTP